MMERVFISVLNNAITVSALIIAIIVVRALGKKMPKWITCLLWLIVAVKLVVPIKFESVLSLIPTGEPISTTVVMENNPQTIAGVSGVFDIENPAIEQNYTSDVTAPEITDQVSDTGSSAKGNRLMSYLHIGQIVWFAGMIVMLLYAVITYILIRKRVSASIKIAPGVYKCDNISDSFILGIISPRIYLPSSLSENAKEYILKHEFAHLSRRDHIWKPLGFAILSVYWFQPLCWVAYVLLCKDIEYACDEKVTRDIDGNEKSEYCRVLLEHSMPRKMIAACPVAFGETDVKSRIKNVANYKKPAFWITIASIAVCIVVGVCFATSRGTKGIENNVAEIVKANEDPSEPQAEAGGQQGGEEKWIERGSAGDLVFMRKEKLTSDEAANRDAYDSPNDVLRILESDGEDWDYVSSGEDYAVVANRKRGRWDIDFHAMDDSTWKETLIKNNRIELMRALIDNGSKEQSEFLKTLQSMENEYEKEQEEMKKNTTPEIKDIIARYYNAVADGDEKELDIICKGQKDTKSLIAYTDYVEKNHPVDIYTTQGLDQGSYVVCVHNECKLYNYDKPVPQFETFYICTDENGKLYIDCNEDDENVASFIESIKRGSVKPEVHELIRLVDVDFSRMLNSSDSEELRKLIWSDDKLWKFLFGFDREG
ncbi:MAG: M56 family metallopeptidase [Butyrivibrio sp.]|nr:M56 family metallopeptidase [Butyrivibrio sp.]